MVASTPFWWEAAPPAALPSRAVHAKVRRRHRRRRLHRAQRRSDAGARRPARADLRPAAAGRGRLDPQRRHRQRQPAAELPRRWSPSSAQARADALQLEAKAAREDLADFIRAKAIDCDFQLTGRFTGAANASEYEGLARDADTLRTKLGIEAHAVPRAEQRGVLGTDFYCGGMVRADIGGLHPAKFHRGMLEAAEKAGAIVHGQTAVLGFTPKNGGFEVETARGRVQADHVLVGTNGYADSSDRWLRRRLVPVRSRIIATAPLSNNLMSELMPKGVMCSETRKLHYYYRPSPDRTRILFGGRDGTIAGEPTWPTDSLKRALADIFPVLDGVDITHSWYGNVAMNRDMIPRIFSRDGMRYAAGYCGSGVVWARWAGQKAAWQILADERGSSALDFRPPPAIPLFNGKPWFLPAVFAWLTLQDRIGRARRG